MLGKRVPSLFWRSRRFWKAFHAAPFIDDQNAIDGKNELRTNKNIATQACCVPKQTSNDEGKLQDLQIEAAETSGVRRALTCGTQRSQMGSVFRPKNQEQNPGGCVFHITNSAREGVPSVKKPFAQVVAIKEKQENGLPDPPTPLHKPWRVSNASSGGDVLGTWVGLVRGGEARLRRSPLRECQRTNDSHKAGCPARASPAART